MGKVVGAKLHLPWLNQALIDAYSEVGHYFYNGTGGSLVAGAVVYKSGTDTTTLFPKVTKAVSTSAAVGATYVVLEDVASTGIGILVRAGKILTALDASGAAVGDTVYLSDTAGAQKLTTSGIGQVIGRVATATNPAYVDFDIEGVGATAGTSSLLTLDNAWTGSQDISKSVTGTDELVNADLSVNHATQIGVAVDATAVQLTTARTSNYIAAFRGSTTSLVGDTVGVIYPTFIATSPTDGGTALHHAYKTQSGYDATIDAQAAATGENDWIVGANLADALSIRTTALSYVTLTTTTATPGLAETWARTGAGTAHSVILQLNHATNTGTALQGAFFQDTTARTSGVVTAVGGGCTSLVGDSGGTYADFHAKPPTDGGGTVTHSAYYVGSGHDVCLDVSTCLTGEPDVLLAANLASAFSFRTTALDYWVLKTTTATPGIVETFTVTATSSAHLLTTTVNSGTGVVSGMHSSIITATTNHTAGLISAYKATFTSLVGDTGGDFVGLELVSVDGGGTTPFHSGIYTASAMDALIKVSADGMGGVVIGSTMTISPENTAESGYFRFNVGATVYQCPIYAA